MPLFRIARWPARSPRLAFALAALAPFAAATSVPAQTSFTWNGGTGTFTDPTQWAGGVAPSGADSNTTLTFDGNATYTATNDANLAVLPAFYLNGLTLVSTAGGPTVAAAGTFPAGPQFRFGRSNRFITQQGIGPVAVTAPLNPGGGTLTVTATAGSGQLTLGPASDADLIYGTGTLTFTNNSSNPILLGNAGSFSGTVNVTAGTVRAARTGGTLFGAATALSVAGSGTFDFNNGNNNFEYLTGLTGAGTVAMGSTATLRLRTETNQVFTGAVTGGTGNIVKDGAGTLTWGGTSTLTGQVVVARGKLLLNNAGTLPVAGGPPGFQLWSGGTLTLDSSTANSTANVNDRLNANASLALGGGTLELLGRNGLATTQAFGGAQPLVLQFGGAGHIVVTPGSAGTATLTFGNQTAATNVSRPSSGTTVDFAIAASGSVGLGPVPLSNGILGGFATVGNEWAALNGTGQVQAYAGYLLAGTTPTPDAWAAGDNVKLNAAPAGNRTTSGAVSTLNFSTTQTLTLGSGVTLQVDRGGVLVSAGGAITGGTLTGGVPNPAISASGSRELAVTVRGTGTTFTIGTVIANPGAVALDLTKSGTGTLVLSSANTYTGNTFLNEGTLNISSAANLGAGGTLWFTGGTLKLSNNVTTSNTFALASGGGTIDTGVFTLTYGPGGGTNLPNNYGDLVKVGTGLFDHQSGGFAVSRVLVNEGTYRLHSPSYNFGGATPFTVATGATLDLSYANAASLPLGSLVGGGAVMVYSGGVVTVGAGNLSTTFSGIISSQLNGAPTPGAGLTKVGTGTLTLGGASTYSGTTSVLAGTLAVTANVAPNAAGPLGNSTTSVLVGDTTGRADAALVISQGGVTISRDIIVQSGSSGVATLGATTTGTATYAGTITLNKSVEWTGGTFSGPIVGAGGIIIPSGLGLTMTAAGTYTGPTLVAGTLFLTPTTPSGGPAGSTVTVLTGGNLFVQASATLGGLAGAGNVAPMNDTLTLTVGGNNASTTYSGNLNGGILDKVGMGTLALIGTSNAYGGGTKLNAGAVAVSSSSALGAAGTAVTFNGGALKALADFTLSRPVAVTAAGGTFDTNGFTLTLGGTVSGSGPVTKAGAGTLVWANPNYASRFDVLAGALQLTGGTLTAGATVANGGVLSLNGTAANLGAQSLAAAAGGTISYSGGTTVTGGFLRGPGSHIVSGGTIVTGVTTTVSAVVSQTGPSTFTDVSNGGALNLTSGATLVGFTNQGSGAVTVAAGGSVAVSEFQSYGIVSLAPAGGPAVTQLTNAGPTPLYLNGGSRTFIGTPATAGNPAAAVDLNGKDAVVAGGLFVNNGIAYDNSTGNFLGPGRLIADYGALIKGAGAYINTPITRNGGRFQAGNSPGRATHGSLVIGPGGLKNDTFQVNNATAAAGPTADGSGAVSGWTMHEVSTLIGTISTPGSFTWTADAINKETITLETLLDPTPVGSNNFGLAANFDPTQAYSWPFVRWAGTYAGPTTDADLTAATSFDTTGFTNPTNGGTFGWHLDVPGQTLSLTFTAAVPEPGTLALSAAASLAAAWATRRRRWPSP